METFKLKKEQLRLASKLDLRDRFDSIKTVGGIECVQSGEKMIAAVVVCSYPKFEFLEKRTYVLDHPLPFKKDFEAYRMIPAIMEAFNMLDEEPDLILVKGDGINHPRKMGVASHFGLLVNTPVIGVNESFKGEVKEGKILVDNDIRGFEVITREHARPIYVSPGHLVSLGSSLKLISSMIVPPHKMPEPLHFAHKVVRKKIKKLKSGE